MWNKQTDGSSTAPSQQPTWPPSQSPSAATTETHSSNSSLRATSCVGASIEIVGKITGEEALQIDGKMDGSVLLHGQRLTVGRSGKLKSEVWAREVIIHGNLTGDIHASDRVEIKKDGSVTGDITTAHISVEDGAYFKGRIEIERTKDSKSEADLSELAGAAN